jgi:phospholipid transport system substrate-binding protein
LLEIFWRKQVSTIRLLIPIFAFWLLAGVMAASAEPAEKTEASVATPELVVEGVTTALLHIAKEKSELLATDPEAYFSEIKEVLDPAVDFLGIAKNVMGKRYWLAANELQREQFVTVFADSLVRTYGKGMATFADFEVNIESSQASESSKETHYVVQSVKTNDGTSKVVYTMRLVDNRWQLKNVVLNGINMGKSFRSQFSQLVKDSDGDVGVAVSKWGQDQA